MGAERPCPGMGALVFEFEYKSVSPHACVTNARLCTDSFLLRRGLCGYGSLVPQALTFVNDINQPKVNAKTMTKVSNYS